MGRTVTDSCDFPGCDARMVGDHNTAGYGLGWVQRLVTDTTWKQLLDGVHKFSGQQVLWLCPRHAKRGADLAMPATDREVVDFIEQEQEEMKNG
jgi:hypothetical protein